MPHNGPSDNRRFDGGDESRVQALMAENERLREALEFYATPATYRVLDGHRGTGVIVDRGERARVALDA